MGGSGAREAPVARGGLGSLIGCAAKSTGQSSLRLTVQFLHDTGKGAEMRVVAVNSLSLDGVMQAPGRPDEDPRGGVEHGGWALPYNDPVMATEMGKGMATGGPLLLGRRTYEDFFSVWPKRKDNPFTEVLNNVHPDRQIRAPDPSAGPRLRSAPVQRRRSSHRVAAARHRGHHHRRGDRDLPAGRPWHRRGLMALIALAIAPDRPLPRCSRSPLSVRRSAL